MYAADRKGEVDGIVISAGKLSFTLEWFTISLEDIWSAGVSAASCTAVAVVVTEVVAASVLDFDMTVSVVIVTFD